MAARPSHWRDQMKADHHRHGDSIHISLDRLYIEYRSLNIIAGIVKRVDGDRFYLNSILTLFVVSTRLGRTQITY